MNIKKALTGVVLLFVLCILSFSSVSADENNNIKVVELMSTEPTVRIKLSELSVSKNIKNIKFAVWSSDSGQDDIKWYTANFKNGEYRADVNLKKHSSMGLYNVHCYITYSDNSMSFLKSTLFSVNTPSAEEISVTGIDGERGLVTIGVSGCINRIGADTVYVGIKPDYEDATVKWYPAERTGTDEYMITVNMADYSYKAGTYKVFGTISDLKGEYHTIGNTFFDLYNSVDDITVIDTNNNETEFKINVKQPVIIGGFKSINIAVWSKEKGQDDLIWYSGVKNGSSYTCTVPVSAHKTLGTYYVHVYGKDMNNKMVFLGSDDFTVDNLPEANVTVECVDKVNGKMIIRISDIDAPAGVQRIRVPVWCKDDQSDIIWYDALINSNGEYVLSVDIKDHKRSWGKYKIFVQISMNNGIKDYAASAVYNLTRSSSDKLVEKEVTASDIICSEISTKTGYYRLSMAEPVLNTDFSYIEYAVWSNIGGNDDVLWFNSYKNSSGKYDADVSMKMFSDYGKYNVSAYGVLSDGSRVLINETSFDLNKPSIGEINISGEDRAKGTFNVILSETENMSSVGKYQVGVKSNDKDAETVWYDAVKSGNGQYVATVNIKNHKYATGKYEITSRIIDFRNNIINSVSTSYDFTINYNSLSAKDKKGTEQSIGLFLYKLDVPAGVKNVKFAVWSVENGQDDLIWYNADYENKYYYRYVPIVKHKTLGKYNVHVYYTTPGGNLRFLAATDFSIESKATACVSVSEINGNKGTYKVTVSDIRALSGVSRVQIPVWSKKDQSDIKWYDAVKQSDGSYVALVDVKNHKYNFGKYSIHVYVTMGNGIRNFVANTNANISPVNYLKIEKINEGKAKLTLINAGNGYADAVSFPTWSKTDGQDDIKWYSAKYAGNGNWTATIETKNHKNYGDFISHVYVTYKNKKSGVASGEYKLKGLDYSQLLSRFTTVSQNNANGTFNMSRALSYFNGVIVQPGETISFFDVAGPCGKYEGFLIAGTVQGTGYGGGICQASTTLYGGALRAGMTIIERRSHSSKSVYVPVGQDAMVSYGSSDFKFRNDHNRPVKIVTYVIGRTLYVEFWGVQESWYDDVEINSWATGSKSAAAERIYYKNGKIVKRERLTNSYYPKS